MIERTNAMTKCRGGCGRYVTEGTCTPCVIDPLPNVAYLSCANCGAEMTEAEADRVDEKYGECDYCARCCEKMLREYGSINGLTVG